MRDGSPARVTRLRDGRLVRVAPHLATERCRWSLHPLRIRQSDMSMAMPSAGWAILIMVAVTAIAAWPVRSAQLADQSLVSGLSAVHEAVGPPAQDTPPDECVKLPNPEQCKDQRPPAQRAS